MSVISDATRVRVCATADVPLGEGRAVAVGDRRIAVFHTESGWYALDDACPHLGGPLSDGLLADRCGACPLHDRRFALDDGTALTGGTAVTAHRVSLSGDEVHVEITERLDRAA